MSRYWQANGHKLESLSERAGRWRWQGAWWEVDREMTRRKERRWLLSMMDAPISQSALGSSKEGCGGWRHLGGKNRASSHTHRSNLMCNAGGFYRKVLWAECECVCASLHLLSRNVSVGAGGRPSLWLAIGRDVQEVPDQNGVVVRTADDLKLIELEAEHAARVLLKTHIRKLCYYVMCTVTLKTWTFVM